MSTVRENLDWQTEALCAQVGDDFWFPEKGSSTRDAKVTCMKCSVSTACLQYAIDNGEKFGVWGGLGEKERRRIKPRAKQSPTTQEAEEVAA